MGIACSAFADPDADSARGAAVQAARKPALGAFALCIRFAPMLSWWRLLVFAPLLSLNVLMVSTSVLVSMLMLMCGAPLVWA